MRSFTAALSGAGVRALHGPSLRRAAFAAAAARGRALILLYHRVTAHGGSPADVVPAVSAACFRAQLEALAAVGDIVPLAALDEPPRPRSGRPRFALTFDDDEPAHVRHALPVLRALGLPATFFLSGRALHDRPPPWWVLLEHAIARRGLRAVAGSLGVAAETPAQLAAACEGTPLAERVARTLGTPGASNASALLAAEDVRALGAAGMEVGFHTLDHPVLTALPPGAARRALHDGRDALAAAAGVAVERFAYPHGRMDRVLAGLTRDAGYRAAYRTGARPVAPPAARPALGRWALARWEPGPLAPDALLANAAFRLTLPAGGPPRANTRATTAPADAAPPRARARPP